MRIRTEQQRRSMTGVAVVGVIVTVALGIVATSCSSSKPIHHYQPAVIAKEVRAATSQPTSDLVLAIEDFSAGAAYDEQRMVYRSSDYRFDYYHFHRWAAPPGMLVSDTLREVYRNTGAFRSVVGGYDSRADVILSGRVVAFEEVDREEDWFGRVVVNMRLRDARTGELLWNDTLRREHKLGEQTPQGLAEAISRALTDLGVSSTSALVSAAKARPRKAPSQEEQPPMIEGPSNDDGGDETSEQ